MCMNEVTETKGDGRVLEYVNCSNIWKYYTHPHTYIRVCVCVCVCVSSPPTSI